MVGAVNSTTPLSTQSPTNTTPLNSKLTKALFQVGNNTNKPQSGSPTWVIPTIIGVGGALVASLVYVCCRIIHRQD